MISTSFDGHCPDTLHQELSNLNNNLYVLKIKSIQDEVEVDTDEELQQEEPSSDATTAKETSEEDDKEEEASEEASLAEVDD